MVKYKVNGVGERNMAFRRDLVEGYILQWTVMVVYIGGEHAFILQAALM